MFPFSSTTMATESEIIGSAATNSILNPSGNLKEEIACAGDKPPATAVLFVSVLFFWVLLSQAQKQSKRTKAMRFIFIAVTWLSFRFILCRNLKPSLGINIE